MGLPRTAPDSVLFGTYNLFNLFAGGTVADREHHALVVTVIRDLGVDVLAVQEIRAPDGRTAERRLRELADETGMECVVPATRDVAERGGRKIDAATGCGPGDRDGRWAADRGRCGVGGGAAVAVGSHGYHVGLLWRPGIVPRAGSLRRHAAGEFWHGLVAATFEFNGRPVRHASHHATPFGRALRAEQNGRLVAALVRSGEAIPTLVGADWNSESADRIPHADSGGSVLYEPADPFAAVDWFGAMAHQCEWTYDARGRRRHWADRRPGEVLWSGGLYDAAAVLRAPWRPTVGHHPADPFGVRGIYRRIDGVRVTAHLVRALRAHHVVDTPLTRVASDHLPVVVDYVPSRIGTAP